MSSQCSRQSRGVWEQEKWRGGRGEGQVQRSTLSHCLPIGSPPPQPSRTTREPRREGQTPVGEPPRSVRESGNLERANGSSSISKIYRNKQAASSRAREGAGPGTFRGLSIPESPRALERAEPGFLRAPMTHCPTQPSPGSEPPRGCPGFRGLLEGV